MIHHMVHDDSVRVFVVGAPQLVAPPVTWWRRIPLTCLEAEPSQEVSAQKHPDRYKSAQSMRDPCAKEWQMVVTGGQ